MKRLRVDSATPPDSEELARLQLHDERHMPRDARRLVREAVGSRLAHLADDASTVVTELATNALLHGSLPAELVVRLLPGETVRLEVFDSSSALPVRARQDQSAMTGRGLALVHALTERWGVQRMDRGKVVWAELREGGASALPGAEADADALLAAWPDLDEERLEPDAALITVHLGDVPTDLLLAAKAHVDNLVREFSLAAAGARTGTTAAVPGHLAELIDSVVHRFAGPRDAIKRQALAAAHAGHDHVRLELRLPVSAADAGEEYLRALDLADDYCRAARLLTLESPPQHRLFRRWYVEELIGQLHRAATGEPHPPLTFEQRLLRELDAVAAAERKAERSARLYTLSSVLASAVTPEAVTQAVLNEGVSALRAAGGAILLASRGPTLALPGAVGYAEQVVSKLREEPVDANLPAAVALRTGEPVWLESPEERNERFPELAGLEPDTVSVCAVPLSVGGRTLGALRFSFSQAKLFDHEERAFVLALAAQTAQALDRAQLYAQRVDVSERLQRSLLPPRLPAIPDMSIEALYRPVGDGVEVGGDFYDVWGCGEDQWAFAIGDASGTGPEAAAMTALVRHTLRALTLSDIAAATMLDQLNRALRDTSAGGDQDRFVTVLLGFLTVKPDHALVELVSGGHPGPLLIRAQGNVEEVGLEGSLLGMLDAIEVDRRSVLLGPGDELLLYTDGITEARRDDRFFEVDGMMRAVEAARRKGRRTLAMVDEVVRDYTRGRVHDDMALLSLRFDGRG